MGRVRRYRRFTTPEILAAALPAELNMLEFCSTVEGLRAEMGRIRVWLDEQVPGRGNVLLPAVLAHIGFDMAGWYRRVLTQPEGCSF
jgi:hypothetical protein